MTIMTAQTVMGRKCPPNVQILANNILTALDKAYPSFTDENHNTSWNLKIDTHGGTIQLTNMLISEKMGIQLPINWLDPGMRVIVKHAGELLERYCVSRDKNIDLVSEISQIKRNPIGEAIHER
jgi:hypothetical protein